MTDEEKKAKAIADALEAEEKKKAAEAKAAADAAETGQKLDKILNAVDSLCKRVDAIESHPRMKGDPKPVAADSEDEKLEIAEDAMEETDPRADSTYFKTLTPEQRRKSRFAIAQARADEVYSAFTERAPAPLHGEALFAYRRRLLMPYQSRSAEYKGADLGNIRDARVFVAAERKIFADAMAASCNLGNLPNGQLRPVERTTEHGTRFIEFHGDHSFVRDLMPAPQYVRRIGLHRDLA